MNAHTHIDERHAIGANHPPEPTPFEAIEVHIKDLYAEAKNWLDGAAIENQAQADDVGRLLQMFRQATGDAEKLRKDEVKPIDEQKAAIQERYNALIGDTKSVKGIAVRAMDGCKAALAPWLRKQEQERQAEAEQMRKEAEEKERVAAEAARAASGLELEAQEQAEALVKDAQAAGRAATRAEHAKAQAGGGGARAVGLRSVWTPTLTDPKAALLHYAARRPDELKAFLLNLAKSDVASGVRTIPGFEINEERVPV